MTVDEMRCRMSGAEFQQWGVYYSIKAQQIELEQMQAESRRGR